jgi:transposase/ribosomal protein L18
MAQPIAPDYGQQFLFPPALEDWVPADHPARFLREFVEQLDLPALGFAMPVAVDGRPPYHPSLLLKIWLYGYFHRIRSTRKLEVACSEHLSLLWLSGLIVPDHNSLWRFWRDNKTALRALFKQTVQLAVRTGAVGLALQALDGTKIQAACSGPQGWSKEYMEKLLVQLDAALEDVELKVEAENADVDEPGYRLPVGLAQRQALRQQIQQGLAQLQADGRNHYHRAEPEARRMKVGDTNRYAYNAQAVADQKEGVIVACEATRQETDSGQLVPMIEQARQNLGAAAQATVTVADTGYGSGADLQAAADKQISVLAPPREGKPAHDNPYAAQHFAYDPAAHTVTCPQGRTLDHEGHTIRKGQRLERFRCHDRDCPVRAHCTGDPKGRQIEVWPHHAQVQAMRERLQQPALQERWRQRGQIIEPRFAQIKQHDGFRRWTVWGLEGVRTQWSLLCATSNLRVLYKRWKSGTVPWLKNAMAAAEGLKSRLQSAWAIVRWDNPLLVMAPGTSPI